MNGLKYVMEVIRRQEAEKKLPVIKMEIDYELLTLYDALQENDRIQMIKSKERLNQLRLQWLEMIND